MPLGERSDPRAPCRFVGTHCPQSAPTDKKAPYGSPEMVASIIELMRKTKLKEQRIFVMEGARGRHLLIREHSGGSFEVLMIFYQRLILRLPV